ncbi:MAG: hypothetical protein ISR52_02595 [Rhodospirillales bacterium]|nr:hypothetical protein [Rhodospirillales bacterium]
MVYIANGLYLLSYVMHDMLRLRLLTVTAACCLAAYFYLQPEPMLTVVYWNLFFVALNVFQITRLVRQKRAAEKGSSNSSVPMQGLAFAGSR